MAAKSKAAVDRANKLKTRYGITEADYNALLEKQKGRCGICGRFRRLSVDHDHHTKKVRGLLCSHCNSGLGLFEESIPNLQGAIKYITTYTGGT